MPERENNKNLDSEEKMWIENQYLAVPTSLDNHWLQDLQQRWSVPQNIEGLFHLAPTQTRTLPRLFREGLEGKITGYREVTIPAAAATAKNSTSILRKPAQRANLIRGAPGYFPFMPGGLEGIEATAKIEDDFIGKENADYTKINNLNKKFDLGSETGLLEIAPGFSRGLQFPEKSKDPSPEARKIIEEDDSLDDINAEKAQLESDKVLQDEISSDNSISEDEIDALLPIEFPALAPHRALADRHSRRAKKEWAHVVNVNQGIPNFKELVPQMAREWPFELDTFQKEAIYHLESGDSIFVAAHTSAGKTVIAEYAIALAAKRMTKAIYTSPIKALSNQKFRDFQGVFNDVGILTGDVQIRPEASCLIMTTEILRSMLYRGADIIRDIEFVIFDEVHYVNDLERGVVWEEVIIMLPEYVTLILLSATVPNTYEFASWIGRTRRRDIYVISTTKRPVPLEHYLWANKSLYKIVDAEKKLIEKGYKDANDALSGKDKLKLSSEKESNFSNRPNKDSQTGQTTSQSQRGRRNQRTQILSTRGHGNISRTGRGNLRTTAAQDRNVWIHLIQHLRKMDMLPVCVFVFSKKRCEENANALSNLDYCTASEKSAIHIAIEKSVARLKVEDRALPQIRRLRELLKRGIAVHHGGMLPIMKEVVEILFAQTLVKVLFATETFAMGLNLPTRTVCFSGYRKHDGRSFRDLLPGEYTQMAGRAGRRGLDSVGYVIIVVPGADVAPPLGDLRRMILGEPTKLRSQFRLTYNMILNLLRVEAIRIEELIKRSFSENAAQALLPEQEKAIELSETSLADMKREPCSFCDGNLEICHENAVKWKQLTSDLYIEMTKSPTGQRMFVQGRLVVFSKDYQRTLGILARDGYISSKNLLLDIFAVSVSRKKQPFDLLPFLPQFRQYVPPITDICTQSIERVQIPVTDIECLAGHIVKIPFTKYSYYKDIISAELKRLGCLWTSEEFNELDCSRVKSLAIPDILRDRELSSVIVQDQECIKCPKFLQHFSMLHDEWLLRENIEHLRSLISDQNLQLLPDYEQRVAVLHDLGFIDNYSRIELKGKVACEIHSTDELVLTELIMENTLADYEPAEIAALLSAFVFQDKTDVKPNLTPALEAGIDKVITISEKVNRLQTDHQVILASEESNDFVSKPRFGMVEVVHEWAKGMSFNRITDLTDAMEGTIVRVITRLDETCREVKNAARIIGDPILFMKMQTCQELIKRDVCSVASLYM